MARTRRGRADHRQVTPAREDEGVTSALKVEIDIHDVVASDQHVVALVEFRVAGAARSLASRQVEIWHVRDDQVTERWLLVSTAKSDRTH